MLKFNIRNQRLTRIDSFRPVEKSVKYLYAEFNFLTPEWEGVRKKLVSERDGTYEADIVDGKCLIPWEALTGGEFKLCVRGIDGEKVIPTNYVIVDPGKTLNEGWPGNEPTPSPEERLQKQIGDLAKLNTENKENLVSAINEVASKPSVVATDDTLKLEDGKLSVNTADKVERDSTLPVTSAAVYAIVGDIEAALAAI